MAAGKTAVAGKGLRWFDSTAGTMETKVYNTIKDIIKRKEEARRWPLNTNILAIAEALPGVPMAEIKKALNALYKAKKIATQNGINHLLIYLNKEQ